MRMYMAHLMAANMRAAQRPDIVLKPPLSNFAVQSLHQLVPYNATPAVPGAMCAPATSEPCRSGQLLLMLQLPSMHSCEAAARDMHGFASCQFLFRPGSEICSCADVAALLPAGDSGHSLHHGRE